MLLVKEAESILCFPEITWPSVSKSKETCACPLQLASQHNAEAMRNCQPSVEVHRDGVEAAFMDSRKEASRHPRQHVEGCGVH